MGKYFNIGDTINDVTIIDEFIEEKSYRRKYKCVCNICKKVRDIREDALLKFNSVSKHSHCNIYFSQKGLAKDNPRLHSIWNNMKSRIYNPNNKDYKYYGGRGLTTEYNRFDDFYNDQIDNYNNACKLYGENNVTMDRIDNNIGYTKDNIRWVSPLEQARNRKVQECLFYGFSPDGKIYISNNKTWFAKNHNISSPASIINSLSNKVKSTHGGWVFKYVNDPELMLFKPYNVIEEFYF